MSELLEPTLLTGEGEGAPPRAACLPVCGGPGCLRGPRVGGGGREGSPTLSLSYILPLVSQVVTT